MRGMAARAGDAVLDVGGTRILAGLLEDTEVGGVALQALLLGGLGEEAQKASLVSAVKA